MTSIIGFFRTNKKFRKNWSFSDFKDFKTQKNFAIEKIFFTCYNYLKEPS